MAATAEPCFEPSQRAGLRLGLFYAAVFAVLGVQVPFWPVWLQSRGLTAGEVGAVLAASLLARGPCAPLLAARVDRGGRRRRALVTLAALGLVAFALFPLAHGTLALLALWVVFGVLSSVLVPLGDSLATLAARTGPAYGRIRLCGSVSFLLAAVLAGAFLGGRSPGWIWAMIALALCATLAAACALPEPRGDGEPNLQPLRELARRPDFVLMVVAAALVQSSHAAYYGFSTLHWRAAGISDAAIGCLWAEGVVAEVLLFWFGAHALRRIGPAAMVGLGAAAACARWIATAGSTALPVLAGAQALHALSFGATHLAAVAFVASALPQRLAATAQTVHAAVSSGTAMGLATLLAGAVYAGSGGAVFLVMAALAALGGLGALALAGAVRAAVRGR